MISLPVLLALSVSQICTEDSCRLVPLPLRDRFARVAGRPNMPRPDKTDGGTVRISSVLGDTTSWLSGFHCEGGLVVTCAHGLRPGARISVIFPSGTVRAAELEELDLSNDIAVLSVGPSSERYVTIAPDEPPVGAPVALCGYGPGPFGVAQGGSVEGYEDEWITVRDLGAREGDSGGPLFTYDGRVVGLVSEYAWRDRPPIFHRVSGPRCRLIRRLLQRVRDRIKQVIGKPEPDPVPQPVPDPDVKPGPDSVPQPAPDPDTEPEPDPVPKPVPDPDVKPDAAYPDTGNRGNVEDGASVINDVASARAGFDPLFILLSTAAAVTGVGVPVAGLYAASVGLRLLWRRRRRARGREEEATDGDRRPAGFLGDRNPREAKEFLRLAQLEGRNPLLDALAGRIALDRLDWDIDRDPTSDEAERARRLKTYIQEKVERMAPLALRDKLASVN